MYNRQHKLIYLILFVCFSLIIFSFFKINILKNINTKYSCTFEGFPQSFQLVNILHDDAFLKSKNTRKIFFIETHVDVDRKLESPRQACSVESAAKTNPDAQVYFIFATNQSAINMEYSELIHILSKYKNIHLRYLDPLEFSVGTILEEFFSNNTLSKSKYDVANRANALRALLLSRYGGQYLDLDVISLVPISKINVTNFGCSQGGDKVNNAVLNFDAEKGRKILDEYARRLLKDFKPNSWGANGPNMLTKALKTFCNNTHFEEHSYSNCREFTILPTEKCYPITFKKFREFYEEKFRNSTMDKIIESQSYFVHIWNKMQDFGHTNYTIMSDSKSAYADLARMYCPKVFGTINNYF